MKINVEQQAAQWYKNEMDLRNGDFLRIFVRIGGCGSVQAGFSLGVMKDIPIDPALTTEAEGIVFYMESDNVWYLDNKDLTIKFDEKHEDIIFEVT